MFFSWGLTIGISGNGYDPDRKKYDPGFTPQYGTKKIIEHIERYFCPTVESEQLILLADPSSK